MEEQFSFDPDRTVLGTVFTHAGEGLFALSEEDRLKHVLVIGKTGMGKTTLLKNMVVQDMHTGRGVAVIDPHGDLSRDLLNEIPTWRARDLVYIDPGDPERVVTFNVVANVPREKIAASAANVLAAFKGVWRDSWGARMERILYASIAALIEAPNTTLLGLPRLLKDEAYRGSILKRVNDPIIHSFFAEEYATWDENYAATAIDPVLNKIEQFLSSADARVMVGTVTSSIDFGEIMDQRKILIANLSKGNLGPGHAHLIGAMLVSGFSHAAMVRGTIDERVQRRVPFYLFVDEFQNFASDSFGEIASEARKWKLGLVLGHQYLLQLPERLRAAILGNAGTIIAFQLSGSDGDVIAADIGLKSGDMLAQLSPQEVWAKHATYGGPHHPSLLPPIVTYAKGRGAALKQNILRNTYPRARVDAQIERFLAPARSRAEVTAKPADRWPLSLRVFRTALENALDEHGTFMASPVGTRMITAVDIQHVRTAFTQMRVADGETVDDRAAAREKAFRRAVESARQRRLVGARERDGVQWIWINSR